MSETVRNLPRTPPRKPPAPSGERRGRRTRRNLVLGCVAGMLTALFAFASVLSYSPDDEVLLDRLSVLDVFRIPFDDAVKALVSGLDNQLGLLGAFSAHFLVDLTLGFFSLVLPILGMIWCVQILAEREKPVALTGYALAFTLLFSVFAGTLHYSIESVGKEWYGLIGAFVADILVSLLGAIGAPLFVAAILAAGAIYVFNLDVGSTLVKAIVIGRGIADRAAEVARARGGPAGEQSAAGGTTIRTPAPEVSAENRGYSRAAAGAAGSADVSPAPDEMDDLPVEYDGDPDPDGAQRDGVEGDEERPVRIDIMKREPVEGEVEAGAEEPRGGGRGAGPDSTGTDGAGVTNAIAEIDYVFPSVELLDPPRGGENVDREELEANAGLVRSKLAHFGVEIESVSVTPGPVITLYELVPASGVKISRIVSLADDLALALAARGIRIMAPIPGKSAVGVEIPNRNPSLVALRSVLNSTKFRESRGHLPLALGKGIAGDVVVDDLTKMPHLLIAGATGSGKSVGINTLMAGLLYRLHPSEIKFVIIDPKKIELTQYAKLKHHYLAVSPDLRKEIITTPEDAVGVLRSVELEMERRYDQLAAAGVRSIQDYNERFKAGRLRNTETITHRKIPYLVVVIDELADLMLTAAKEVEDPIARLAQLARAVGIHLVLATQRPSVDVITGVIKANFPARIAFQVASKIDSRTILDMNGAEQLLGSGDMLYLPSGSPKPIRIQNAFISSEEIERLTEHISRQEGYPQPYMLPSVLERRRSAAKGASGQRDEFFEEAARLIVRHQQGSVSLLQRRLKVGYSRAARLVDELESAGIVGPYDGSKAREVLLESDEQLDALLKTLDA